MATGARAGTFLFCGGGFLVHILYLCGKLTSTGVMTTGDVTQLCVYSVLAGGGLQGMLSAWGESQKAMGSLHGILEHLSVGKEKRDTSQKQASSSTISSPSPNPLFLSPEAPSPNIKFEDVWFKYPLSDGNDIDDANEEGTKISEASPVAPGASKLQHSPSTIASSSHSCLSASPWVLKGCSFSIPEGGCVGLVGSSGSGKSSLLGLLMSLYSANEGRDEGWLSGKVFVGSDEIGTIPPPLLRSIMTIAPQEASLFATSLEDNLLFPLKAEEELLRTSSAPRGGEATHLQHLLKSMNLSDFCAPSALAARVGERGGTLSGGQRQRLTLTRALMKANAKVVILDEPTSSLDATTAKKVHQLLRQELRGKTSLVVTHSVETLKSICDSIVVLSHGKIVQEGSFEEVLSSPCREMQALMMTSSSPSSSSHLLL